MPCRWPRPRTSWRALDPAKYEVVPIGITRAGHWLAGGDPLRALKSGATAEQLALPLAPEEPPDADPERGLALRHPSVEPTVGVVAGSLDTVDVIFPVLHGPYGEDGTIQGLLEAGRGALRRRGRAGVGAGHGQDRHEDGLRGSGAAGRALMWRVGRATSGSATRPACSAAANATLGYPMFAKPANLGSSVGISKIHGPAEFAAALDRAARYDRRLLVEQGLDAREIECSVLGNDDPRRLGLRRDRAAARVLRLPRQVPGR